MGVFRVGAILLPPKEYSCVQYDKILDLFRFFFKEIKLAKDFLMLKRKRKKEKK